MPFTPHTDADRKLMLETIGVESIEALFRGIPKAARAGGAPDLPPGLPEAETLALMSAMAGENRPLDGKCFLGAGCYRHYVPALVSALSGRGEFLTAYTPYQPEFSQGALQVFFEFQTMMCALTGMEVSNASVYDGASAVAEAALMSLALKSGRRRLLLSRALHPEAAQTVRTITRHLGVTIEEVPLQGGVTDAKAMDHAMRKGEVAAVILQSPNFLGCLEDQAALIARAHEHGALTVVSTYPVSLGLLEPPGGFDADIVVGDGGCLGNATSFGGPHFGFLTTRAANARKAPGRIVGETVDLEGKRGYVLILQTREQHIRREHATSNICTNQGLNALQAAIFLSALGKQGFADMAKVCAERAGIACERLTALPGVDAAFDAPFFNEFTLVLPRPAAEVIARARKSHGVLPGVDLGAFWPDHARHLLVACTELNTIADIDLLVEAVEQALR